MLTAKKNVKAVILVAGPQKGTRFRPLSLEVPKFLFPVAGFPLLEHHIASCKKVEDLREIIILGYYQLNDQISRFIEDSRRKYGIVIKYLQEYEPLGTAGGLYHFRDQINDASAVVVIHADIFCVSPLECMLKLYEEKNAQKPGCHVVLGTQVYTDNSTGHSEHGNMIISGDLEVRHYVEKPENHVSAFINCGVYVFHPQVFDELKQIYVANRERQSCEDVGNPERMFIGKNLFSRIAGKSQLYCHMLTDSFWGSMKSAGSAIFANKQYLASFNRHTELVQECRLAKNQDGGPAIEGDVYIHPSARVDPSAKIGPNVAIGCHCVIGAGVRVRESIILDGAELRENSCVLYSIIGWRCLIGAWSRVEGTPNDPNPNHPHALIENESLFHPDGKLISSITILGCNVTIPRGVIVLNSIVLPHKELSRSHKNQIIL